WGGEVVAARQLRSPAVVDVSERAPAANPDVSTERGSLLPASGEAAVAIELPSKVKVMRPVGVKPATWPVTWAVSCTTVPSGTSRSEERPGGWEWGLSSRLAASTNTTE